MKKNFYIITAGILFSLALFIQGCSEDPAPSIYDSALVSKPAPTIVNISPSEAIAVVTPVTITGTNFSTVLEENTVLFNGKPGKVTSATATQLVVIPANVVSDSTAVKVRVKGAEQFSNVIRYKVTPAVEELKMPNGDVLFTNNFVPHGIAIDAENNLFVSVEGPEPGVKKISPDRTITAWAPKGAESYWVTLRYTPQVLYGSKNLRGVWKILENTIPVNAPWAATPTGSRVTDLDLDANLNVWAVGNNRAIYMIPQTGDQKNFEFVANLRAVRVFNNMLYTAGAKDGVEGVWRFQINGSELGTAELYFNFTQFDAASIINTMTFSADGDLYLGTNRNVDPIIVVKPDGSGSPLYPTAIPQNSEVISLTWDMGNFLYFTRNAATGIRQTVFKINMEKPGAPHFGRN